MKAVQQVFPQSKWHRWDPINRDNMRAGSKLAFGGYYDPIYKFENAAVVVSLDADFLSGAWFPGFERYARDFMRGRKLENGDQMNLTLQGNVCDAIPVGTPPNQVFGAAFTGNYSITGGTGHFTGQAGTGTFSEVVSDVNSPDAPTTFTAVGSTGH